MPDSLRRIQETAGQVDIPAMVALAREMSASGTLDVASAEWLLEQARFWHVKGYLIEQQNICEIISVFLPNHVEVLHLLGYGAQLRGDYALAEEYYVRALKAKPAFAFSQLALAQLRMMLTHFAEGRREYESRFDAVTEGSGADWRGLPIARWQGESLSGKKLYLWAEQGLGDIIMFAAFLPALLAQSPRRIALGMFPKLISLFKRSFPAIAIEPADDAINLALGPSVLDSFPQIERLAAMASVPFDMAPLKSAYDYARQHGLFDVAAPMGDLMVYGLPGYVPARHPAYLAADPARVKAVSARLDKVKKGRRIGISWHTTNKREMTRNIPLEEWIPLFAVPGCHFVSLQHHADPDDIARFCSQHHCHITVDAETDLLADAEGLAALAASMDEIITIDNSNVHLAGALGIRTTLLLPVGCNYRWPVMPEGATLWYSSVTALRQEQPFSWQPVMAEALRRLQD